MSESSWNEIREHEGRIKQMQYVRGLEEQIAALTKERDAIFEATGIDAHDDLPEKIRSMVRSFGECITECGELRGELERLRAEQRIPPGFTAEKLDALASWIQATRGQMVLTNADVVIKQLTDWATWVREHTEDEWTPEQLGDIAELAAEYSGPYRRLPKREQPKQEPGLTEYLLRQSQWSRETFGSGRRTLGVTRHIEKEVAEIRSKPDDLSEWIDVIILAMDGYWRHGGKPEDLLAHMQAKQDKNFARQWPAPTSEDEAVEHVREPEQQEQRIAELERIAPQESGTK